MTLELKNIGMIKEANVKIDGLTVIAGENDTGKSTVGKALFLINQGNVASVLGRFEDVFYFEKPMGKKSLISFNNNKANFEGFYELSKKKSFITIFIDTPIVINLFNLFSNIDTIQSQVTSELINLTGSDNFENDVIIDLIKKYSFKKPFTLDDLYKKIKLKLKKETSLNQEKFVDSLKEIIDGEFVSHSTKEIVFKRGDREFDINSVATGIKSFGLVQLLIKNNHLTKDSILILDEPEVHLHPKWQLEMAKIIVELVKNSVKVVVNSHSPYMIEALKRYSEVAEIEEKTNFYLAENGYIKQIENSNSLTLEQIFEKLSEPFDVFDKMDSERLQNG